MDLPASLVMTPGQTLSLALPGLGGAGYLWSAEVSDEAPSGTEADRPATPGAVVTATVERGGPGPRDPHDPVGGGLPETLRLTAHSPGTATLHLAQRRPWETGPPRDARHTEVVVTTEPGTGGDDTPTPLDDAD